MPGKGSHVATICQGWVVVAKWAGHLLSTSLADPCPSCLDRAAECVASLRDQSAVWTLSSGNSASGEMAVLGRGLTGAPASVHPGCTQEWPRTALSRGSIHIW